MITALAYSVQRQDPATAEPHSAPLQLSAASAPPPIWMPIPRPLPIFGIDAPALKSLPFAFTARRDAAGAREDTLTFGWFEHHAEPHLRVILHRAPHAARPDGSLFLELARRASGAAGLAVTRSTPSEGLATKFGTIEVTEVTLSEVGERGCLGFRFAHQEVGFRLAGWLCPAKGQALDRHHLACTLDGLSLIEAGNDEQLKVLFAEAQGRRVEGCALTPRAGIAPRGRVSRPASRSPPRRAKVAQAGPRLGATAYKRSGLQKSGLARRADQAQSAGRG